MPLVTVNLLEGRPPELLESLIGELTATVVATLGVEPANVRVILNEVPADHWGVGGISKLRQRETGGDA